MYVEEAEEKEGYSLLPTRSDLQTERKFNRKILEAMTPSFKFMSEGENCVTVTML